MKINLEYKKFTGFLKSMIKNKRMLLLIAIFLLHLSLRFYDLEGRTTFGWDQVDNAWAANSIISDHELRLTGMEIKGASGLYIGPAYYYLISVVYFLTNLDPIASGIFAGITSIFSFSILFYISKKIFSFDVGLISVFLNTVTLGAIMFDKVQWPVQFIPAISLIIFYSLYKIISGSPKYMLLLAIALGFSFHIHFTSIFYTIMIIFTLPFFPRSKETLKYILVSIPLFLLWLTPILIVYLKQQASLGALQYGQTYYHGLHGRRMLQLANDAFIQFEPYLHFDVLKPLKFILLPLFVILWFKSIQTYKKFILPSLVLLWFIVPWVILSTYSGEITDYYFASNRFVAVIILAFLIAKLVEIRNILIRPIPILILLIYGIINVNQFIQKSTDNALGSLRGSVLSAIAEGETIKFKRNSGASYLYHLYTRD